MRHEEVTAERFIEIVNEDYEREGLFYKPEITLMVYYISYFSGDIEYECFGSHEELYRILCSLSVNIDAIIIR